jgi:sugar transferase (PEP-CTERM system associated)
MRTFLFPLMIGDLILGFGAIYLAFSLSLLGIPWVTNEDAARTMVFLLVVISSSFVTEIYSYDKRLDRTEIGVRILFALSFCFMILAAVDLLVPHLVFEQRVTIISLFSFGFLQFLWHAIYRTWDRMSGFAKRVLILGTGPLALQMGTLLASPNRNHMLLGYFHCSNKEIEVPGDHVVGKTRDGLYETAKRLKANKVVVSLTERRGVFPLQEILSCKLSGIQVLDAPTFYEQMTGSLLLEHITPSWFIFSEGFKVTTLRRVIKRMMDVLCSIVGILLISPLLPLLAMAIRLDSRGPVIYRQVRVGEGDQHFYVFKFRTMREDAEQQTGAVWAGEDDPRITRVGRFLRKTRLDELPQLFNVLKGDMSFVGPRPERPEFVAMLKEVIPYYSERHFVKPGITGWAQVSYPYGASVEDAIEKLRYDLYYIKNLCGLLDIFIILKTIHVVLFGKGGR